MADAKDNKEAVAHVPQQTDMSEKGVTPAQVNASDTIGDEEQPHQGNFILPPGRKYRQLHLFGLTLPWYASPKFQLGMVAFVCFMCPGMFNALSGLGGGGKQDATLADNMVSDQYTGCFTHQSL